ncbi:HNH endonuclease signature motif containing protein [Flexivirga endophytica]|uniref:HNH endonuclease signature motif containing protein n=1 Tax=Flexivirga endophytica TaxID=1849103 RepID=UPI00166B2FCE|nr:HNH endonuclease signature motif containing protein [Flexivirga endophytica]
MLGILQAAAQLLDEVPGAVHQLGDDQEAELMTVLLRLQGRSSQVGTIVAADAVDRGAVTRSDAATTGQWISGRLSGETRLEPKTIRVMASVADACQHRKNTVITQALLKGSCSVESARTALLQADKVGPVIPTAERDDVMGWFLQIDPSLGCDGLTRLTRAIIDRFAPDELSKDDETLEGTESLSWSTTATGMTRLVAELSPANAAILKEAITAKSAPRPAKPTDPTDKTDKAAGADETAPASRSHGSGAAFGLNLDDDTTDTAERSGTATNSGESVRDERSPGKRRVDALMDLVGAGARAAAGDGVQASAATVLLTMGLQELLKGHGGTTGTGDVLDAGAARRLACTADLIPVVLGGPSQPLDVGRRERLATKAIRAAVILRDGGCSFPDCDRPPGFCEIHHVTPWWAGGETSLTDSAMLCGRHHQTVHRQGYTADVRPDRVVWDLTPGRMPGHQTATA